MDVPDQTVLELNVGVPVKSLLVIVTALVSLAALHLFVNRTRLGTAMRGGSGSGYCVLNGYPGEPGDCTNFFVGGAMGGLAGVLFGLHYSLVNPYSGFFSRAQGLYRCRAWRHRKYSGAMLGGMVLGMLEAFAASYLSILTDGAFGAEYKDVFAFVVLILILILRPKGLLGEKVREEGA